MKRVSPAINEAIATLKMEKIMGKETEFSQAVITFLLQVPQFLKIMTFQI